MDDDGYEMIPHTELLALKSDLEDMKKNPLKSVGSGDSLVKSMDKLTESLSYVITLFREAGEQFKEEERESEILTKRIIPLQKKLDALHEQNKIIAEGILSIADMVKEVRDAVIKGPAPLKKIDLGGSSFIPPVEPSFDTAPPIRDIPPVPEDAIPQLGAPDKRPVFKFR